MAYVLRHVYLKIECYLKKNGQGSEKKKMELSTAQKTDISFPDMVDI